MARVVERGLRRTVGAPGLFATAYGNVGSSIYYALGLVAAHALGLTPLVFIFAGGLFPGLRHNPGDIIGGFVVVAVLAGLNIRGLRESANLNIFLAIADLVTQVLLVILGAVLIFDPSVLVDQIHLGSVPTYKELIFALSISMVAYTGI